MTQLLLVLGETLDRLEGAAGGGEPIWKAKNREGLNHAIEIIVRATGQLEPSDIEFFLDGAVQSLAELDDDTFLTSYHAQAIARAKANVHSEIEQRDFDAARLHWTSKWPKLNSRTRSSVEAGLYSILHVFNTGIVWDLLGRSTTVKPDDLEGRKWWLVNMPVTPGDAPAVFVNAAVKLAVQRVHPRPQGPARRPAAVHLVRRVSERGEHV